MLAGMKQSMHAGAIGSVSGRNVHGHRYMPLPALDTTTADLFLVRVRGRRYPNSGTQSYVSIQLAQENPAFVSHLFFSA